MSSDDGRLIIFFDIDNTLYSAKNQIAQAMGRKIHEYFVSMGWDEETASDLHLKYYTTYGLALAGLVRHHQVDPLDFDQKCDGALPLEDMIKPSESLRKLFQDIDRSKAQVWALTNAYKTHASRVLRILNLEDQIDGGLIFCDYAAEASELVAKPNPRYYHKAIETAKVKDVTKCYFVDDNRRNVEVAAELGWGHVVHFCEEGLEHMEGGKVKAIEQESISDTAGISAIKDLEELRVLWPEIFHST